MTLLHERMKMAKIQKCSICGWPLYAGAKWQYGHNAEPVNGGRCCDECNYAVLVPARLQEMAEYSKARAERRDPNDE